MPLTGQIRVRLMVAGLLAGVALAGCSSDDDSPSGTNMNTGGTPPVVIPPVTTTPQSAYEKKACSELVPQALLDEGVLGDDTVECGFVTVPADWSQPDGASLKLAVYKIPAKTDSPAADPLVYLEGGPGGAGVGIVGEFATGDSAYLRDRSDIYSIDQRGTGYSQPALYCSEVFQAEKEEKEGAELVAAYKACHDRLVSDGVNFKDYNSRNNALDVRAVRQALGIAEWNLYGLSYGTRLALTVMRDAPEGVRSVVLDSVFPPEINGITEVDYPLYFTIDQIGTNCAADTDCNANLGNLKDLTETAIARLDANPIGELTAPVFIEVLSGLIAESDTASGIATVANGTEQEITTLFNELQADGNNGEDVLPADVPANFYPFVAEVAEAMFFAVVCAEETPYPDAKASPDVAGTFTETTQRVISNAAKKQIDAQIEICNVFNVPAAGEIETKAVTSDIPTLVLAGTADVATPPAWSMLSDESLPNSQYAEFDGLTHGLIGNNACLNNITLAFLNNTGAAADQSCIVSLPRVDYKTM